MSTSRSSAPFLHVDEALRNAVEAGWTAGAVFHCAGPAGRHTAVVGQAQRRWVARPMSATTIFDLASLTKVLATTWLAMKWADAGRLDLDAPLQRLCPGLHPPDKGQLTVRLLMTHAAGLPAGVAVRDDADPAPGLPGRREAILERFRNAPLAARPGERMLYSDVGPILVGDLLEQLAGRSLDALCAAELYQPLDLADTFFVDLRSNPAGRRRPEAFAATEDCPWRSRVVVGQVHDESAYLLDGVAGNAGLFSTVDDVSRIAAALLAADRSLGVRPETVAALTRPQGMSPDGRRAFGWDTARPDGPGGSLMSSRAFGHTGFTGTSLYVDPELGLYVVLLANRVHPSRQDTGFRAFRRRLHDLAVDALTLRA